MIASFFFLRQLYEIQDTNKDNFENICIAIAIGEYFGVSFEQIKKGIESYLPENNRSQVTITERNTVVLDAYNANPTSMEVSIKAFALNTNKNGVVILGDMFELGNESENEHQAIANLAEGYKFNGLYLIGKAFSAIDAKNALTYSNFKDFETFEFDNNYSKELSGFKITKSEIDKSIAIIWGYPRNCGLLCSVIRKDIHHMVGISGGGHDSI